MFRGKIDHASDWSIVVRNGLTLTTRLRVATGLASSPIGVTASDQVDPVGIGPMKSV
jgi:hypothetical protein